MPYVNASKKLVRAKIVYVGPGRSGKSTNLRRLHETFPEASRGALIQLDTQQERTLFFDYFPAELGRLGGYTVRVDFFSVPGQAFYQQTRTAVLAGVDGVVFVADSDPDRELANHVALRQLQEVLVKHGRRMEELPLVFQWNKRDVRGCRSEASLQRALNPAGRSAFPAVAFEGAGVWDTQREIVRQVLLQLRDTLEPATGSSTPPAQATG
ncbi:MAG: GTPase domain-containing protein [Alphaproteobacteria bacterium]|nr:GTPase domain-containing protein [Alphaproteobacteria bacterium]MCB9792019.1 GTPase domain-containing protein [Alphaproteobacteria bacterium]